MNSAIIQTLWIGSRLSAMEQLSIASFLHHGCDVHLYVYDPPEGIPIGATIRDAAEILPRSSIFTYAHNGSYAGFANFFRYKLLLERGGWWVDTDLVCVREFNFEEPYVFSSEAVNGAVVPNVGALRVPPRSAVMEFAWDYCRNSDVASLRWGQTGPALIRSAIEAQGLHHYVQPPHVFCPIGYADWQSMIAADYESKLPAESRAVHLWNEMWRRAGVSKDDTFPPSSLFETLKHRYLGDSCASC